MARSYKRTKIPGVKKHDQRLYKAFKGRCYYARQKNIEFTIEFEDLSIPSVCPIMGIELYRELDGKRLQDNLPSIDRVDNSKGYVPGNVRVISLKANKYKGDMTIEQVERMLKYMKSEI